MTTTNSTTRNTGLCASVPVLAIKPARPVLCPGGRCFRPMPAVGAFPARGQECWFVAAGGVDLGTRVDRHTVGTPARVSVDRSPACGQGQQRTDGGKDQRCALAKGPGGGVEWVRGSGVAGWFFPVRRLAIGHWLLLGGSRFPGRLANLCAGNSAQECGTDQTACHGRPLRVLNRPEFSSAEVSARWRQVPCPDFSTCCVTPGPGFVSRGGCWTCPFSLSDGHVAEVHRRNPMRGSSLCSTGPGAVQEGAPSRVPDIRCPCPAPLRGMPCWVFATRRRPLPARRRKPPASRAGQAAREQ